MRDLQHRCTVGRRASDRGDFRVEAMPDDRGCVEVRVSGEIDLANVDRFAERLDQCITVPGSPSNRDVERRYVFDVSQVSFLGVDGSRVIVGVAADLARRGADTEIRGLSQVQRRVIELLGHESLVRSGSYA